MYKNNGSRHVICYTLMIFIISTFFVYLLVTDVTTILKKGKTIDDIKKLSLSVT